jgi:hypothetical protein
MPEESTIRHLAQTWCRGFEAINDGDFDPAAAERRAAEERG